MKTKPCLDYEFFNKNSDVKPDFKDEEIAQKRLETWEKIEGPRIGDFIKMKNGTIQRFSHDWGNALQTSEGGSFYFGDGYVSFSGGLNPSISKSKIKQLEETKRGSFWFFHHDYALAFHGIGLEINCRVFEQLKKEAD